MNMINIKKKKSKGKKIVIFLIMMMRIFKNNHLIKLTNNLKCYNKIVYFKLKTINQFMLGKATEILILNKIFKEKENLKLVQKVSLLFVI